MNDLREAAKQVLEAWDGGDVEWFKRAYTVMDALRAALAQQAEPLNLADPSVRKRLASQWGYVPAAAQAEPVQEPVAWRYKPMIGSSWSLSDDGYYISCKRDKGYTVEPLYTAPPQRTMVPLTEEEIVEAVREADLDWQAGWTLDEHAPNRFDALARAVEKASWEKNHG